MTCVCVVVPAISSFLFNGNSPEIVEFPVVGVETLETLGREIR